MSEGKVAGSLDLPFFTLAAEMSFASCCLALVTSSSGGWEYLVRISYGGGMGWSV